jgi:hypothetical protein
MYKLLTFLRNNYVDYQLHFLYAFLAVKILNSFVTPYLTIPFVLLLIIWKEVKDTIFDWNDVFFGILGIILAIILK